VFEAVNEVRKKRQLQPLVWHSGAAEAARSHSRAMAERGFFSHIDPRSGDPAARLNKAGVRWRAIAENLFQQRGCPDSVQCAIDGWLNSPDHRRNLLNPGYTHTGVGITTNERGTSYYTQIFLIPASRN
jgi:uncharacterized protein YkwD